jgi:hypothetical protein
MPPVSTQSGPTPPTSSAGGPPNSAPPASGSAGGPVGPDGFDESSQQSTLSQSSDRSDGRQTPKQQTQPHPGPQGPGAHPPHNFMGNFGHHGGPPGSPHSSAPSPGGSLGSSGAGPDGGYPRDGMASPSWQRPPASPVSTPQVLASFHFVFLCNCCKIEVLAPKCDCFCFFSPYYGESTGKMCFLFLFPMHRRPPGARTASLGSTRWTITPIGGRSLTSC